MPHKATGFIVGPNTIVTAAHVVAGVPVDGSFSTGSIMVYPGDSTDTSGASVAGTYYIESANPTGTPNDTANDFAVINVDTNLASTLGISEFFSLPTAAYSGGTVNITGYPDPPNYPLGQVVQFNDIGTVTADSTSGGVLDEDHTSVSSVFHYSGNSGGPLWVDNGSTATAVGIVSSHSIDGTVAGLTGYDVQLTPADVATIDGWKSWIVTTAHTLNVAAGQAITGIEDLLGGVVNVAGSVVNTIVEGVLNILSGGKADPTTIYAGGREVVNSGGADLGALISGGEQDVFGSASGATVSTGSQVVEAGGSASGATVDSGGSQTLDSGGSAADLTMNGTATIDGGTLELLRGASGGGPITFAVAGGTLKIDGSVPTNVISGFAIGDVIDLAAVTFASSGTAQLTSGNVLEVVEGGSSYNLQLNPNASFAGEIFKLTTDGRTGTDVTFETAPTLAITSKGGLTNQTAQTISGTIDAADAGLTVSIYDGTTLLGTATPAAGGSWSASVTLLSTQGAQAITAQATDAAGLGTSSAVTYTLVGPSVTVAGLQTYASLINASAGFQVAVVDTAANVQAGLASLTAEASHITSITATGGLVSVSLATFTADKAALAKIVGGFAVADNAADLLASANAAALAKATSVTLTGTSNTVNAAQAEALAKLNGFTLGSGAKLTVADNAADLLNGAYAAGVALATAVTLTGASNTVSALQAQALTTLTGFALGSGAKLTVADSAADLLNSAYAAGLAIATGATLTGSNTETAALAEALTKLNGFALGAGAKLAVDDDATDLTNAAYSAGLAKAISVTLTGTSNSVSAAQAAALTKLKSFAVGSGATLTVSDSAASLLNKNNAAGLAKATSVTLRGANTETAAQAEALTKLKGFALGAGATLIVSDSAANLLASANAAGVKDATSVTLTGSNNETAAQAETLAKLNGFALGSGAKLTVSDSAADLLNSAYAAGLAEATSVTLTGSNAENAAQAEALAILNGFALGSGAKLAVSDSAADLTNAAYAAGLAKATSVTLTGAANVVSAAEAAELAGLKGFALGAGASLAVDDSAADVATYQSPLKKLAAAGDLAWIEQLNTNGSTTTQFYAAKSLAYTEVAETDGAIAFTAAKSGVTITATSAGDETFTGAAAGGDTFAFYPGFGADSVTNFAAVGPSHNVLEFSVSCFTGMTSNMTQAADLLALLADTANLAGGGGAMITDSKGDTLTLDGLTKATLLSANAGDFKFT